MNILISCVTSNYEAVHGLVTRSCKHGRVIVFNEITFWHLPFTVATPFSIIPVCYIVGADSFWYFKKLVSFAAIFYFLKFKKQKDPTFSLLYFQNSICCKRLGGSISDYHNAIMAGAFLAPFLISETSQYFRS